MNRENGLVTIHVAAAGDGHLESFVWHTAAAAAVVVVVAAAVAAAASVACKFVVGLTLVGVEGVETVVCLMAWSYTAVAVKKKGKHVSHCSPYFCPVLGKTHLGADHHF